jgi:hypothetical protein
VFQAVVLMGVRIARRDAVDADALGGKLLRHAFHQQFDDAF